MRYFIFRDGGVSGPFEEEALRKAFANGEIPGDTQVSNEGEEAWRPLAVALGDPAATPSVAPSPPRAASDEKYWGFISYSHQDKEVGTWLHKKLEGYRIPSALVGRLGRNGVIPDRLFPIFRDREELPTSSNLSVSIQEALAASRYLIVLCSPRSAVSHWVNAEICAFDTMGKRDRILALILEGEPHATEKKRVAADECFPPALRFVPAPNDPESTKIFEPIASDLRPGGDSPERALLKIVAGLIGVNFDELFQRERRRKRKRQVFGYILLTFGLFLVVGLFLWNSRLQKRQESVATELETMKQLGPYKEIGKLPAGRQQELERILKGLEVESLLTNSRKLWKQSEGEDLTRQLESEIEAFKSAKFGNWKDLDAAFGSTGDKIANSIREATYPDVSSLIQQLDKKLTTVETTLKSYAQNLEEKLVVDVIVKDLSGKLSGESERIQSNRREFKNAVLITARSLSDEFETRIETMDREFTKSKGVKLQKLDNEIRSKERELESLPADLGLTEAARKQAINGQINQLIHSRQQVKDETGGFPVGLNLDRVDRVFSVRRKIEGAMNPAAKENSTKVVKEATSSPQSASVPQPSAITQKEEPTTALDYEALTHRIKKEKETAQAIQNASANASKTAATRMEAALEHSKQRLQSIVDKNSRDGKYFAAMILLGEHMRFAGSNQPEAKRNRDAQDRFIRDFIEVVSFKNGFRMHLDIERNILTEVTELTEEAIPEEKLRQFEDSFQLPKKIQKLRATGEFSDSYASSEIYPLSRRVNSHENDPQYLTAKKTRLGSHETYFSLRNYGLFRTWTISGKPFQATESWAPYPFWKYVGLGGHREEDYYMNCARIILYVAHLYKTTLESVAIHGSSSAFWDSNKGQLLASKEMLEAVEYQSSYLIDEYSKESAVASWKGTKDEILEMIRALEAAQNLARWCQEPEIAAKFKQFRHSAMPRNLGEQWKNGEYNRALDNLLKIAASKDK